ncbi:MAG TPA: prenyltransferase/squalene oxidase repeat-containing protein, partial [Micromonospora sp.]
GLPCDADTTSVALYALGQLGRPVDPASLLAFRVDGHFCTWQGEDGFSVTTNAHVLEALGAHLATAADHRFQPLVEPLTDWLAGHQQPDGQWQDRWHASPYYATACSVSALDRYGRGGAVPAAVGRAVRWVLDSQRPDGSWGRWSGTVEETAYALQVLLGTERTAGVPDDTVAGAAVRGYRFLRSSAGRLPDPPLWHDKDLYLPGAIVRGACLAAVHLVQRRLSVTKIRNLIVNE